MGARPETRTQRNIAEEASFTQTSSCGLALALCESSSCFPPSHGGAPFDVARLSCARDVASCTVTWCPMLYPLCTTYAGDESIAVGWRRIGMRHMPGRSASCIALRTRRTPILPCPALSFARGRRGLAAAAGRQGSGPAFSADTHTSATANAGSRTFKYRRPAESQL